MLAIPRVDYCLQITTTNWIEEVQVAAIGAPAEYGGFTGVVANYVTRSGGNQFHGLFEIFFQNENLNSSNTQTAEPEAPFKSYDISAQVGGPIHRRQVVVLYRLSISIHPIASVWIRWRHYRRISEDSHQADLQTKREQHDSGFWSLQPSLSGWR